MVGGTLGGIKRQVEAVTVPSMLTSYERTVTLSLTRNGVMSASSSVPLPTTIEESNFLSYLSGILEACASGQSKIDNRIGTCAPIIGSLVSKGTFSAIGLQVLAG